MRYYYVNGDNETAGPVSERELWALREAGVLNDDSFVASEGSQEWQPFGSVVRALPAVPSALVVVEPTQMVVIQETKACPFCAETIALAAKKCKHCGEILDPVLRASEEAKRASEQKQSVYMNAAASTVVVADKKNFPHFGHLVLSLVTLGFWFPIWVLHYLFRSRSYYR